jgi:DNA (cytosine-5)-methyltransferase 1
MGTYVSLFAGVGGFDLGLEAGGHECVGQVEIDKKCLAVLEKHWPNVPKHNDVVTAKEWANEQNLIGKVDIV